MPSHRSPSFSRLKDVLTQLPHRSPIEETEEENSRINQQLVPQNFNADTSGVSQADSRHTAAVQQLAPIHNSAQSSLAARPGKGKVITRPSTFRLAVELQDALKAVAEYNGLNMTDIVAESIWLHLQNFQWPPESDQLRQRLSKLI